MTNLEREELFNANLDLDPEVFFCTLDDVIQTDSLAKLFITRYHMFFMNN